MIASCSEYIYSECLTCGEVSEFVQIGSDRCIDCLTMEENKRDIERQSLPFEFTNITVKPTRYRWWHLRLRRRLYLALWRLMWRIGPHTYQRRRKIDTRLLLAPQTRFGERGKMMQDMGYVGDDFEPRKCIHCGHKEFYEETTDMMGEYILEADSFCKRCDNIAGSWAHGHWNVE